MKSLNTRSIGTYFLLSISCVFLVSCSPAPTAPSTTAAPSAVTGQVKVQIDFGDESDQTDIALELDCFANSTVFSIMDAGRSQQRLEFKHRQNITGAKDSIFIDAIAGVKNGAGKYWTFFVNDRLADRGCGIMPAGPDDIIRWIYGEPDDSLKTNSSPVP